MRLTLLACLFLLGCGSKTALDEGVAPEAPDAGFDAGARRDAGTPVTLPCRWSLGVPGVVGTAAFSSEPAFRELGGATVGDRSSVLNRAVVLGNEPARDAVLGGVVTTVGISELLGRFQRPRPFEVFSGERGFFSRAPLTCEVTLHDLEFEPLRVIPIPGFEGTDCHLSQTRLGALDMVAPGAPGEGRQVSLVTGLEGDGLPRVEPLLVTETTDAEAVRVIHQPGRGTLLLVTNARGARLVERHGSGRVDVSQIFPASGTDAFVSAAPDRLNGGLLTVLERPLRLVRFGYDGPLEPELVVELDELPAAIAGDIASNETEALLPLADGSMVYVPLATPSPRYLSMDDVAAVAAIEIVLRPDDSAGGLVYETNEDGRPTLWFRPLTCNR